MPLIIQFEPAAELTAKLEPAEEWETAENIPTLVEPVTDGLIHELAGVIRVVPAGVALGALVAVVAELCERCRHPQRAKLAFVAGLTLGQRDAWIE
jgi:hypothetical protein